MVRFRRPNGGQLLLLSLIPTLVVYHTSVRGDPLGAVEFAFVSLLFVTIVVATVVEGGLRSPAYLIVCGSLVGAHSVLAFARDGDLASLAMGVVALLIGLRGLSQLWGRRIRTGSFP